MCTKRALLSDSTRSSRYGAVGLALIYLLICCALLPCAVADQSLAWEINRKFQRIIAPGFLLRQASFLPHLSLMSFFTSLDWLLLRSRGQLTAPGDLKRILCRMPDPFANSVGCAPSVTRTRRQSNSIPRFPCCFFFFFILFYSKLIVVCSSPFLTVW